MRISVITSVIVCSSFIAAAQTPSKKPSPIDGTWVFESINGQPPAAARGEIALAIAGGTYRQLQNGQEVERGTISVTSTKTALALTMKIGSGQSAGKTQLGFCVLQAAKLTCKLAAPDDSNAPTDVTPQRGQFQFTAKKR